MRMLSILFIGCVLVTNIANAANFRIFRSDPQALVISMNGNIKANDTKKLRTILGSNPFAKEKFLVLNSIGGVVAAGIEMGQVVLNSGVRTIIPIKGRCLSACSMVFAAGWDDITLTPVRYHHVQRLLGVDHPYNESLKSADPHVMNAVQTYFEFLETGIAHYRLTSSIPPRMMTLIKNTKLNATGDHKVVGLSETQKSSKITGLTKTQKTSRANKRHPRKTYARKQRQLERWRRSFLENND